MSEFDTRPTERDIAACFRLLLGRDPGPEGWSHFRSALDGLTLGQLVETIMCSEEFRAGHLYNAILAQRAETPLEVVELDGYTMRVDPGDPMSGPVLTGIGWEPDVTAVVESVLRPGMVVVDIGANMGHFSLLAAARVGSTGVVHAFEPGLANAALIQLSAVDNAFEHLVVHPVALDERAGVLMWERAFGSNARVHRLAAGAPVRVGGRSQLVQATRLDDIAIGPRVDLVKIDVEGAELLALRGAEALLRRNRPVIVSEFAPVGLGQVSGVSGEDYLGFLLELGYHNIAVIASDGSARSFGRDTSGVVEAWRAGGRDHIDLVVR
jgi:FkbM family methyltransferase